MKTMKRDVLLIEDNASQRMVLEAMLGEEGYFPIVFEDAVTAFQSLEEIPNVILLDYRLPRLDGLEAARILRNLSPSARVILYTAHDRVHLEQRARDAGAFACVEKLGPPADLLAVVDEAFSSITACRDAALSLFQLLLIAFFLTTVLIGLMAFRNLVCLW